VLKILILSLVCFGLAYGQEQQNQAALAEQQNQERIAEESNQMELEMVRAERKGLGSVYLLLDERTKKQAAVANKTKDSSDVLKFERMASSTLQALSRFIDQRGFTYRLPSDNPNSAGEWVPKSYMMDEEAKKLANLLDESLRDPKK